MNLRNFYALAFFVCISLFAPAIYGQVKDTADQSDLRWAQTINVRSNLPIEINSKNKQQSRPGINAATETPDSSYGSQYCRLLSMGEDKWLAVYTVRTNKGYRLDSTGGLRLEIAQSTDNGSTWKAIARLKDPGRDLDNGQLIRLSNGHILLASRSVRWQSSYRLPVYESKDGGLSWAYLSSIDANEGDPGTLGHPDKGIYEPHFQMLDDGRLAVFYANEKHVTESPSFSQVISEKISTDNGRTWGKEIWVAYDPNSKEARPGMPVINKMKNDSFMIVYEVCGTKDCNIYQKTSTDGKTWAPGIGTAIPQQSGAPFILSMTDGRLVVTSNRGNISFSDNYGRTWKQAPRPWLFTKTYDQDWKQALWPAIYQFGPHKIGITAAIQNSDGHKGHHVKIRFGKYD